MADSWNVRYAQGGEIVLNRAGLHIDSIFEDPRIHAWRDLPERQNCVLEPAAAGSPRLHIKRFKPPHGHDAAREAHAVSLLLAANIRSVPLVAHGVCKDGRGFLISEDLSGYAPADRVLKEPAHRANLPERIADMALQLHKAGLHHRDLYLCHFFVPDDASENRPLHLIDPGRVARLPAGPMRYRWIVKDLAQLYYSVTDAGLPITLRDRIISRYIEHAPLLTGRICRLFVPMKAATIARHDASLRQKQPGRRVTLGNDRS